MHGRSQTAAAAAESFKAWRLGLEMVPLEATSSGFFFFFSGTGRVCWVAIPWQSSF